MGDSTQRPGGGGSGSAWVSRAERPGHSRPVRWGQDAPIRSAVTENLSTDGLFIITPTPIELMTEIQLLLHFEEKWESLRGVVVWNREPKADRPAGIGVQLIDQPARYLDYVKQLS